MPLVNPIAVLEFKPFNRQPISADDTFLGTQVRRQRLQEYEIWIYEGNDGLRYLQKKEDSGMYSDKS